MQSAEEILEAMGEGGPGGLPGGAGKGWGEGPSGGRCTIKASRGECGLSSGNTSHLSGCTVGDRLGGQGGVPLGPPVPGG